MGCLFVLLVAMAPRIALILMWLFSDIISRVFDSWIWPLLGLIFVPFTTIIYVLVWNPITGVSGWDWLWVGMALLLDVMKWAGTGYQGYKNREYIPGVKG